VPRALALLSLFALFACAEQPELDTAHSHVDQEPRAIFYGGLRTWGSLGLDDTGGLFQSVDAVAARFEERCEEKRLESGLGDDLQCQADLITVAPTGRVTSTQGVAERLIEDFGARISIDIRANARETYKDIEAEVRYLFSGRSYVFTREFLELNAVGLSLDFEPQVVVSQLYPSAYWTNRICNAYKDAMLGHGHDAAHLECWTYEFGRPTMVSDAENLEPWIYPMLMSYIEKDMVENRLIRDGIEVTDDNIRKVALEVKEFWIDNVNSEYAASEKMGCMFFEAPYLFDSERDMFSFEEGLQAFGDKCDIVAFQ